MGTEIEVEPELALTFWITYKLYGKEQESARMVITPSESRSIREALSRTPGVTDIKIDWES